MNPIGRVPLLGQQQQQLQAQIQAAIHSLAVQIYAGLAQDHIANGERTDIDPEHLRRLARKSATAARCYFEGLQQQGEAS